MDAALDAVIGKVRQAAERARPLRIRGGGSKDFYGQRLHGERGEAARLCLYLFERDQAVDLLRSG